MKGIPNPYYPDGVEVRRRPKGEVVAMCRDEKKAADFAAHMNEIVEENLGHIPIVEKAPNPYQRRKKIKPKFEPAPHRPIVRGASTYCAVCGDLWPTGLCYGRKA